MKTLKEICLEASILADIEDTLNVDITKDIFDKIFKSQSKDEFNTRVELLKTILNTKPEKVAVLEMRSHIAWYLKGIEGAARVKDDIFKTKDINEIKRILKEFKGD
jgi:tRNA-dihydrouridine synthase